ncbi:MAG: DUF3124 domain-containing protein [Desulfobacterales bacterium]|nr:MAG: DUF3124 domain-containing protein [Desulfobacterales bacterium]
MQPPRSSNRAVRIGLTLLMVWLLCANARAESIVNLSKGQTVYVAIYSHIYSGDRDYPFDLSATLSIRNTDLNYPITILSVDYYDSNGKFLKKYIDSPIQLDAIASIRYVIRESDKRGGSGANFIVRWKSDAPVNQPLIESVMIGTKMQQGISFTSRGQVIQEEGP